MDREMEKHCVTLMILKVTGCSDEKAAEAAAMIDRYYEGFKDDLERDMDRELTVDEQAYIDKAVAVYAAPVPHSAASSDEPAAWQWCMMLDESVGRWGDWIQVEAPLEKFKEHFAYELENGTARLRPLYAAPTTSPEPDAVREIVATLKQWVEALRTPTIAEHTIGDIARYNDGRCITEDLELAIAALSRPAHGGWEEALKPLAGLYDQIDDRDIDPDTDIFFQHDGTKITFGDIRRARALLSRNDRVTSQPDTAPEGKQLCGLPAERAQQTYQPASRRPK